MKQIQPRATAPQPTRRYECSVPTCGKSFSRKEHLNRHLKSHDAQFQHRCHLCGRRYARSDVLKRHIENHPQSHAGRRTVVACIPCHERKLKCDDGIPCRSCIRSNTSCTRYTLQTSNELTRLNDESNSHAPTNDNSAVAMDETGYHSTGLDTFNVDVDDQLSWPPSEIDHTWTSSAFPSADFEMMPVQGVDPSDTPWMADSSHGNDAQILGESHMSNPPLQPGNIRLPNTSSLSSTVQTSTSSENITENPTTDQQMSQGQSAPSMKYFVENYFAHVHCHWPVLHEPTFDIASASSPLLASVMLLASCLEAHDRHVQLYPAIFEAVVTAQLESSSSLEDLQALLLCIVYAIQNLTRGEMLIRALHLHSLLISACRYRGIFDGRFAERVEGNDFEVWLIEEQARRLAYATLRVDVYLSILVDHPPTIRYQELHIPLPKSVRLWSAFTDEERRKLQWEEPAGREKAVFSTLIRDSLDPKRIPQMPQRLSESDYHLALCSLHAGSWEAAQEAHSAARDKVAAKAHAEDPLGAYRAHLHFWRARMEDDCHFVEEYFSSGSTSLSRPFSATTIILWHISMLKMHAPLDLLRGKGAYYRYESQNGLNMRQPKAHLQHWLQVSCSRIAVWNAAQIFRVFVQEATPPTPPAQLKFNCLALPDKSPGSSVDLFDVRDDDANWIRWRDNSEGLATWGPHGPLICQCQLTPLVAMFRKCLSRDKYAETGLVAFIDGLSRN